MDKGKKPIMQEEDFLSHLGDIYDQPNTILSPLTPPEFITGLHQGILSELDSAGSSKETPLVQDEMEGAVGDFFSKSLSMDFSESPNMEQYSKLPILDSAVLPVAQPQKDPVVPPRAQAVAQRPGDKAKPFEFRKAMPRHELEKLALHDPKRAKRIMTNRQSAVRAKEKKKLYTFMLEHKLSTLQSKSAKMSARLTLLQTESKSLNAENTILKDRMDIAEQQVHLQDALNDHIRGEIQHMKTLLKRKFAPSRGVFNNVASSLNINQAMNVVNVPLSSQQFPSQLQVQNPYPYPQQQFQQCDLQYEQQNLQPCDIQQQLDLEQLNFGVQYEQREPHQLQHLHQPRYDLFQVQNEQAQAHQVHYHQQQ